MNNICFQIHALRKEGYKIVLENSRYIIKKGQGHPLYGKNLPAGATSAVDESHAQLASALNDSRLLNGIKKIHEGDRATYLELLRKVVFYRRSALNMLETTEMFNNFAIGVGQ